MEALKEGRENPCSANGKGEDLHRNGSVRPENLVAAPFLCSNDTDFKIWTTGTTSVFQNLMYLTKKHNAEGSRLRARMC